MLFVLSKSKGNSGISKMQGGFIHVLLLVLFVISVTLWGVSEIFFRATEKQQEAKRRGDSDLRMALDALVDYATVPPPRLHTGGSFLSYNAVDEVPFRRFVLPCPDLIGADNNLDGAADFSCSSTDNTYEPLVANSRFGRFPWRDDLDSGVRGAGNRDFRGRYGERFWYIVSNNVVDRSNFPGNPNSLLKLTSGWLTLEKNGKVISDRIAALVIAPGAAVTAVVSEERLFAGEGAVPFTLVDTDISTFASAYLDNGAYDSLITELRVSISTADDNDSSADKYAYLTIDELAGAGGKGVKLVDDADGFRRRNIYSQLEDGNGFLGISDLLQAHLDRYGYLPEPAVFGSVNALKRERRELVALEQIVTITSSGTPIVALSASAINTVSSVSEGFAARNKAGDFREWRTEDLDPGSNEEVYALSGIDYQIFPTSVTSSFVAVTRSGDALRSGEVSVSNPALAPSVLVPVASLPPVYIVSDITLSLDSITQLNALPPYNIALAELDTGLNKTPLSDAVVSLLISEGHYPDKGLFGIYGSSGESLFAVDESNLEPNIVISGIAPITIQNGVPFTAALSEPAFGYFQGDSLVGIISYFGGSEADVSLVPPYGVRVLLPAGTRLTMDTASIAINLPAGYRANGTFDAGTGMWSLSPSEQAVLIDAPDSYIVEVPSTIPNDWPIVPGDFGFLPFNKDANTRILNTGVSVSLAISGGAVSDLAVDIGLYTENRLTVVPFPPPGRPSSVDFITSATISLSGIGTGVTTTITSTITLRSSIAYQATPLFIGEYSEFRLPVGTRVLYPKGGVFNVGTRFAFPAGAMAYFPPDVVLQVVLPISAVSPGGRNYDNSTMQTLLATLHHGGMLGIGAARAVLEDGFGLGSGQELFDIEMRGLAQVMSGGTVIRTLPANAILQPYTGRAIDAVGPVDFADETTLTSPTRIRGRFLTSERNAVYHADGAVSVGNFALSSIVISGFAGTVITTSFDEDTSFWLPSGEIRISKGRIHGSGIATDDVPRIVLQASTGIYDSDFKGLYGSGTPADMMVDHELTLHFYNNFQEALHLIESVITLSSQSGAPTLAKVFTSQDVYINSTLDSGTAIPRNASRFVGNPALATANIAGVLTDTPDSYTFLMTSLFFTATVDGNLLVYGLEVDGPGNYQPYFSEVATTVTSILHNPDSNFRLNHFALFLDNDIHMISNGVTTALLAGGVVDVVNANYWPPSGIQRLKRIADDLEMVSAGEVRIYLPERTALRTDIDEHIITLVSGMTAIVEIAAPDSVVLPYVQYARLDVTSAIVDYYLLTVRGSLSLPANAMIIIPAGRPLEFLSENTGTRSFATAPGISLYAELVDYAHLPAEAVAVIPPGEEFYYAGTVNQITSTIFNTDAFITSAVETLSVGGVTVTVTNYFLGPTVTLSMTVTSAIFPLAITMTGPGYLPLGDGFGRAAFINNQAHLPAVPLVFLSELGRLVHGNIDDNLQDDVFAFVPAHSRLDMLGYMETRAEQGVFSDLLPADYEALLRDYPMGYAVASECRRHAVASGSKCGDGPGLTFNVPGGEEVILSEVLEAPTGGLLTVTHPGASLIVRHQSSDDYLTGATDTTTATVAAALIDHDNGIVSFPAGEGVVVNPGDVLRFQLAPHHSASVIRMFLGRLNFGDSIEGVHYADINGEFTVNVGGIVGEKYDSAAAVITLTSNTTLNLGVGAKLRSATNGERIFGDGSFVTISVGTELVELELSDYSIIDAAAYSAIGTLAMAAAEVDSFGGVFETYQSYEQIPISGVGAGVNLDTAPLEPINVAPDASIEMLPGYLWQGYIPPGSTLSFSENTLISPYSGLEPGVYLRVHPTVRALNFFGTGLERPEGLDGRGPAPAGSVTFNTLGEEISVGINSGIVTVGVGRSFRAPFAGIFAGNLVDGGIGWPFHFTYYYNNLFYNDSLLAGLFTITTQGSTTSLTAASPSITSAVGSDPGTLTLTLLQPVVDDGGGNFALVTFSITNTMVTVTTYSALVTTFVTVTVMTLTANNDFSGHAELTASIANFVNITPFIDVIPDGYPLSHYEIHITVSSKDNKIDDDDLRLYARVFDDTGVNTVSVLWNESNLIWNRYSNPFPSTLSYEGRFDYGDGHDLWALPNVDGPDGNSQPSYIEVMCNSQPATAYFNPPPFQLAASIIAPPMAWKISVAGVNYKGLTMALPIDGRGSDITVAEQRVPDYAPLTIPPDYLTISTTLPVSVNFSGRTTVVDSPSDLMFYIDTSYNTSLGGHLATIIIGPITVSSRSEIVPHYDLVAFTSTIHGATVSVVPFIVNYTITVERHIPPYDLPAKREILFGDNFVINGPGAIVPPFGGNNKSVVAEVYAARSKLFNGLFGYPALSPVYDEKTGDCVTTNDCAAMFNSSDWVPIVGGVVALGGVNVSVTGPSPQLLMPQPQALVKNSDGKTVTIYAGSILLPKEYKIYPAVPLQKNYMLFMSGPGKAAIDVNPSVMPRPVRVSLGNPHGDTTSDLSGFHMNNENFNFAPLTTNISGCIVEPIAFSRRDIYNNFVANEGASYFNGTLDTTLTATYRVAQGVNQVVRHDGSFVRGFLLNDKGAELVADYYSGRPIYTHEHGFSPANIYNSFPRYNTDHPLENPLSYHRVVSGTFFLPMGGERRNTVDLLSPSGLSVTSSGEFVGLRLAHRIDIPRTSIPIKAYQNGLPYPSDKDNMFTFPAGSEAMALNVDAGSWESIHPYLGVYSEGLRVNLMTVSVLLTVTTTVSRGNIVVGQYDDAYVRSNISNKRLLHYTRAESLPGDDVFSAAPIYSNVWIRLPDGGRLEEVGGSDVIYLPPDSIVNPLLGTYLSGEIFNTTGGATESKIQNSYLSQFILNSNIRISRPAYTLPKGTKMVVAAAGARFTNVKAAVFFSLTPKDGVSCPYGAWEYGVGQPELVTISQTREGISENFYETATGKGIVNIGHPCAWFDDPENTDGDNVFLYRGRRRNYVSELRVREISNDRTYLVGGVFKIN